MNIQRQVLPGTFDVSTVCTVGGGADGTATDCTCDAFVGLEGCTGLIPGLRAKLGLGTGTKPLGAEPGAAGCANLCPVAAAGWDVPTPCEAGTGGPGWLTGLATPYRKSVQN